MADLDELMTDERVPAWQGAYQQGRNDLRAELREPLRALRESHDALVTALREIASGTSGPLGRDGSSFDELFAYVTSVARAALAKAEALGAVGAQG